MSYSTLAVILRGTRRDDFLTARWDRDQVFGLGGDDRIESYHNDVLLVGGNGDDRLFAELQPLTEWEGPDRHVEMRGGRGDDVLKVRRFYDLDWEATDADTTFTHRVSGGAGSDKIDVRTSTLNGYDTIEVFAAGGAGRDRIRVDINTGNLPTDMWWSTALSEIEGGSGKDRIRIDLFAGGDYTGGRVATLATGGDGNDAMRSRAELGGGDGGTITVQLDGESGNDTIESDLISDKYEDWEGTLVRHEVSGGFGNDEIRTLTRLEVGSLSYVVDGGSGNDIVEAALTLWSSDPPDYDFRVSGGAGDDALTAIIDHSFGGVPASVTVSGGTGSDRIIVVGGDETLLDGGDGDDRISGGSGRDELIGGNGADILTGGGAADRFLISPYGDGDIITDFDRTEDILVFSGIVDQDGDGLVDDLDEAFSIRDGGPGESVTLESYGQLTLLAVGTGNIESIGDLVDDPSTQLLSVPWD